MLGLFWLLDLPLDWKISLILMAVAGFGSSISFYDGSRRDRSRMPAEVLMRNVEWDFANAAEMNIDDFISAVSAYQGEGSEWDPDQRILAHGSVEVHLTLFHRDTDSEKVIVLAPTAEDDWTQGRLLHALHHRMDVASLGDSTFFEGLVKCGDHEYYLRLGS